MPLSKRIEQNRFLHGVVLLVRRYFDHRVGRDTAALTYYLLFAIFPCLIFLSNLVGIFAVDIKGFLLELNTLVPDEVLDIMVQYLDYVSRESSTTLLTFSLVFTIWFPMRAAGALLASVRKAYGMGRPTNALRYQATLFLYTIFLILTVLFSLVLVTVGERFLSFVSTLIYISPVFVDLWTSLRFLLLGVLLFLALAALYALAQETREVHYIWPGVLLSLVSWMILSLLFSLYVETFSRYSVIYGSIGAIVVLLIWLYLAATMLIMGAEFNSVLQEIETRDGRD